MADIEALPEDKIEELKENLQQATDEALRGAASDDEHRTAVKKAAGKAAARGTRSNRCLQCPRETN